MCASLCVYTKTHKYNQKQNERTHAHTQRKRDCLLLQSLFTHIHWPHVHVSLFSPPSYSIFLSDSLARFRTVCITLLDCYCQRSNCSIEYSNIDVCVCVPVCMCAIVVLSMLPEWRQINPS